jgi:Zinc-binding dehydrogenase
MRSSACRRHACAARICGRTEDRGSRVVRTNGSRVRRDRRRGRRGGRDDQARHEPRQRLAREYGATDVVEERGGDGVARIKELTNGLGAHSIVEAVGTQESMMQAIRATGPADTSASSASVKASRCPRWSCFGASHTSTEGRSSTSSCRSRRPPRATRRWINGARSRCSCALTPTTTERQKGYTSR